MGLNQKGSLAVVLAGLLAGVMRVSALPLNLDPLLEAEPDLFSSELYISYEESSDAFSATGNTSIYTVPGPIQYDVIDNGTPPFALPGTFELLATIDETGTLVSGTVTIGGRIPDYGVSPVQTLLTGTLTQFGFDTGNPAKFEFLFNVTGGALAGDYGPVAGIIMDNYGSSFAGSFTASFDNDSTGVADTRPLIPEPSTALLVGCAGAGLAIVARRSRIVPRS